MFTSFPGSRDNGDALRLTPGIRPAVGFGKLPRTCARASSGIGRSSTRWRRNAAKLLRSGSHRLTAGSLRMRRESARTSEPQYFAVIAESGADRVDRNGPPSREA